ncbi:MAG: hypothetical protein HOE90_01225 [Bacteriovoracaceae bacterium]|nr:hypothetical protein [Bacteriovoracaceae bacterium]
MNKSIIKAVSLFALATTALATTFTITIKIYSESDFVSHSHQRFNRSKCNRPNYLKKNNLRNRGMKLSGALENDTIKSLVQKLENQADRLFISNYSQFPILSKQSKKFETATDRIRARFSELENARLMAKSKKGDLNSRAKRLEREADDLKMRLRPSIDELQDIMADVAGPSAARQSVVAFVKNRIHELRMKVNKAESEAASARRLAANFSIPELMDNARYKLYQSYNGASDELRALVRNVTNNVKLTRPAFYPQYDNELRCAAKAYEVLGNKLERLID